MPTPARGKLVSITTYRHPPTLLLESRMDIESWCMVECNSNQQWTRAERKHVRDPFKSTVFNFSKEVAKEDREASKNRSPKDLDMYKKRKHFPQKCE